MRYISLLFIACAFIAQQKFRHKTKKTSFQITFWVTVILNNAALIWLHTDQGAVYLNTFIFTLEDFFILHLDTGNIRTVLLILLGFHA